MTDHLANARTCVTSASQAPNAGSAISWLTTTCMQIITHLEAQQTEASLRRGLADITAGRTVDLGSFAQPEPEQLGGSAAAHIACAEQTTARQDADLTASQGETGHEDQYETDFNRWLDSLSPGQREQITRDIEAAHDLIRAEAWDEAVDTLRDEAVDTLSGPWEDMIPAQIADLDRRNPYRKEQP